MNESGTREQDEGIIDILIVEALGDALEHVRVPSATPPHGEFVLTVPYAGDDTLEHQHHHSNTAAALE
eukprot:4598312-Prorocentrum_lima.AAC.1